MEETRQPLPSKNIGINIKYALNVAHDASWYEVKSRAEYSFWLIEQGSCIIHYGGEHYELSAGDIFFFYPGVLYNASSTEGCRFTFIHFDVILGNNYRALHFYPFDGKYAAGDVTSHFQLLLDCAAAMQQDEPFAEMQIQGALMHFLALLMKHNYSQKGGSKAIVHDSALARLQPVLIYINHHITDTVSIEELAGIASLSEKYFITFFKDTMGTTPIQYITSLKMKKALEYLHEQDYSIKETAALVGYPDIYAFSKAFKKVYGAAPSKFAPSTADSAES